MIYIFTGIALFLLITTVIHAILSSLEKKRYPPPGSLIDIGRGRMHLYCRGDNQPTVVFSSGCGSFSYGSFYKTFSDISKTRRAAVYDRLGYGWSDDTDRPRSVEELSGELHALLKKAGERPPFVLAGHSLGAEEALHFAHRYREETAGLVLLDPAYFERAPRGGTAMLLINRILSPLRVTGLLRLFTALRIIPVFVWMKHLGHYPEEIVKVSRIMFCTRGKSSLDEFRRLYRRTPAYPDLGNLPVLVLTAEHAKLKAKKPELHEQMLAHHRMLSELSSRGAHRILPGTDHSFPLTHPDEVTRCIEEFIRECDEGRS